MSGNLYEECRTVAALICKMMYATENLQNACTYTKVIRPFSDQHDPYPTLLHSLRSTPRLRLELLYYTEMLKTNPSVRCE